VLTLLFLVVAWDDVWGAIGSAALGWIVLMYGALLVRQVVDAFQLRYLLGRVGSDVPVRRVFLASQLASFYSLVLPGDIAASAAKWSNLSVATGKRSLVLSAMVYNKLLMLSVPALIGTIALIADDPFDQPWLMILAVSIVTALVFLLVALYHPILGEWTERVLTKVARRLPAQIAIRVGYLADAIRSIRTLPMRHHLVMISFALVSVSLGVLRLWLGMMALGLGVSVFSVLWVMAFALIGRILPITIASLGIRESLLAVALTPLGVAREQAVALGLLGFSSIVLLGIIGGVYQAVLLSDRSRVTTSPDGEHDGSR
jgi:uncharacterized membrane protein YbhN (UPF0104 family)